MNCKYCGKESNNLKEHELNGMVCESCLQKLDMSMPNSIYVYFMGCLKQTDLRDAYSVMKTWLDREFSIVRFKEFKFDKRLKYKAVLQYVTLKEMQSVKFPVIVEVRIVERNNKHTLKITIRDDTKVRNTYIFGKRENNTLTMESDEIQYVNTDMTEVLCGFTDYLRKGK